MLSFRSKQLQEMISQVTVSLKAKIFFFAFTKQKVYYKYFAFFFLFTETTQISNPKA